MTRVTLISFILVLVNMTAHADPQLPSLIQGQCTPELNSLGNFATPFIQNTTVKIVEDLKEKGIEVEKTEYGKGGQGSIAIFDHPDFYTFALETHFIAKDGRRYSVQSKTMVEDGRYAFLDLLIVPIYIHDTGKDNSCEFIKGKNISFDENSMPSIVVVDDATKKVVSSGLYDTLTVAERSIESKKNSPSRHRKSTPNNRDGSPIRGQILGGCQNGVGLISVSGMRGSILGCQ